MVEHYVVPTSENYGMTREGHLKFLNWLPSEFGVCPIALSLGVKPAALQATLDLQPIESRKAKVACMQQLCVQMIKQHSMLQKLLCLLQWMYS
jgi:hypothetical protein